MAFAKRIFLFIAVNFLVYLTIELVLTVLGVHPYLSAHGIDYGSLMAFCLIWGMVGSFISLALSKVMAKWMMGVKVISENAGAEERELVAVVNRCARAAGLSTMPEVGIYESPEINAFATGPTRNSALVAVSTGLLRSMNHDQLEGVIGHEVTHIANGDMVTLTLIQGIVNAFVMFFARVIAFAIAQNVRDSARPVVHMITVMVLQIAFSFLGMMVVAHFSRFREFRADAGGARVAGREKMVSALRALQARQGMVDTAHPALNAFKINGQRTGLGMLLATHPPLDVRIARLEKNLG